VNHDYLGGLVRRFQGSEGRGRGKIYMMLAKMKRSIFWQGDESKVSRFYDNQQMWSGFWKFGL